MQKQTKQIQTKNKAQAHGKRNKRQETRDKGFKMKLNLCEIIDGFDSVV